VPRLAREREVGIAILVPAALYMLSVPY
jgi:hypothetical protein